MEDPCGEDEIDCVYGRSSSLDNDISIDPIADVVFAIIDLNQSNKSKQMIDLLLLMMMLLLPAHPLMMIPLVVHVHVMFQPHPLCFEARNHEPQTRWTMNNFSASFK
jgi:hypothetical protein